MTRVLKQWTQNSNRSRDAYCQLPTPPPPPRPRRRFISAMEKGLLQLVRCTTFVRLLRCLLGFAVSRNVAQYAWSEALTDLTLNLIIVALYEDAIAFA